MSSYANTAFVKTLLALACLALPLLSACGFHFASQSININDLPDLNIQSQLPSIWQQQLYRFLKRREVNNYPSSNTTLWIGNFSSSKRPVSLNSRAKVAEYSLTFSIDIRVTDAEGYTLLPYKKLTTGRIYRFNEEQVPGKQAEENFLQQSMMDELFDQMLRLVYGELVEKKAIQPITMTKD